MSSPSYYKKSGRVIILKLDLGTLLKKCESPIEQDFLCAAYDHIEGLVPQYLVLGYRLDFAIPDKRIAIELDGHDFHKTKEQRTYDAKKDRDLMLAGWRVARFTGSEVWLNATRCVADIVRLIGKNDAIKTDYRISIDDTTHWFNKSNAPAHANS